MATVTDIQGKTCYIYETPGASDILIQPVDDHDLESIDLEVRKIKELAPGRRFTLVAFKIEDWNRELSPWQAPPAFGDQPFGDGASDTLDYVLTRLIPHLEDALGADISKNYHLGGYSLAGFFALWAAYQTDRLAGIAAASPSVWFPGWKDYMTAHAPRTGAIYLSLGAKEEKTRNQTMAQVGDNIRLLHETLTAQGVASTLEWNPGNHFVDSAIRTAKAFAWLLGR